MKTPFPATAGEIKEKSMNTADDRHLQTVTSLAWTTGPRAARSEQARAIGELAAAIRRWARNGLSAQQRPARDGILDGAA